MAYCMKCKGREKFSFGKELIIIGTHVLPELTAKSLYIVKRSYACQLSRVPVPLAENCIGVVLGNQTVAWGLAWT